MDDKQVDDLFSEDLVDERVFCESCGFAKNEQDHSWEGTRFLCTCED